MDTPDLIIPIRMDPKGATDALNKVSAAGKKAGDDVATAARKATGGLQESAGAAGGVRQALVAVGAAQVGLSVVKGAAAAITTEFKRAADYVKSLASDFSALRKTMQEVATLKGEPNSNQFTVAEAKKGEQFHLNPQEYRDFQAEFMNFAGAQISDEIDASGKAVGKLTSAQGEQYAGRVAALMKESGINPAVGAELAGSLLEQAKGPQDVDTLMKRLSETFNVLEKGRVPLSRALPQMSEIMAHGVGAEEAARMFNIVAPASPGQEGVAVQAAFRAIEAMKIKGTGQEFGVKEGMTLYESVKAFSEDINKRRQSLLAEGKSEQEATDALTKLLTEKDIGTEVRERRGLISGFARQGIELGGFKTFEGIAEKTPEDFEAARKKRYEESDQGLRDAADVRQAVARAERGEKLQAITLELERARAQVIQSGEMERPTDQNAVRGFLGNLNGVDLEQQLANKRALSNLGQRAAEAGIETRFNPATEEGRQNISRESIESQIRVNQRIAELLEEINRKTPERNAIEQKPKPPGEPGKSLAAPPPGGAGQRQ
jgi:hypothetical protein